MKYFVDTVTFIALRQLNLSNVYIPRQILHIGKSSDFLMKLFKFKNTFLCLATSLLCSRDVVLELIFAILMLANLLFNKN